MNEKYQSYNIHSLKPIELDDLMRVGNLGDGGYVLSRSQIEKSQILLSFGINHDWSFEWDFAENRDVILHGFDYSVSKEMFCKSAIIKKIFEASKLFFFKRKFSEASQMLEWARNKKNFGNYIQCSAENSPAIYSNIESFGN
jgi:hypothetical protein